MSEADFDRLRRTPAGKRLVSAYRLAGVHAHQVCALLWRNEGRTDSCK